MTEQRQEEVEMLESGSDSENETSSDSENETSSDDDSSDSDDSVPNNEPEASDEEPAAEAPPKKTKKKNMFDSIYISPEELAHSKEIARTTIYSIEEKTMELNKLRQQRADILYPESVKKPKERTAAPKRAKPAKKAKIEVDENDSQVVFVKKWLTDNKDADMKFDKTTEVGKLLLKIRSNARRGTSSTAKARVAILSELHPSLLALFSVAPPKKKQPIDTEGATVQIVRTGLVDLLNAHLTKLESDCQALKMKEEEAKLATVKTRVDIIRMRTV